jgi:hypothetical protein
MDKVKSFIVGFCVLAFFLCLFTLFIPRHVTMARAVEIHMPADSLQAYLEDFHAWPQWCSWMGADSVVTRRFEEASATQEATVIWYPNGQSYNKNFISILQTNPGEIRLHYQFKNLLPATGGFTLTKKDKNLTFLEWKLEVKLRWYPWEKLSGIAMDKVWGRAMGESLRKLKLVCRDSTSAGEADPESDN